MNPYRAVAERLQTKGWHKGSAGGYAGPNCLVGAAYCIGADLSVVRHAYFFVGLDETIREQFPERIRIQESIAAFNDHEETTFEDVMLVLEKAAIRVEERVV